MKTLLKHLSCFCLFFIFGADYAIAQNYQHDFDQVVKKVDDLLWYEKVGDIAHIDKVYLCGPARWKETNPTGMSAGNELKFWTYIFIPKSVDPDKKYPLIVLPNDLPMIQTANFMTPYDNALYKLSDLRGRLLSYGKASDMNSFYVPVTFEFDNKGAVIPGSFVEIFLLTKPMENVLSVPVSALIEEQGVYSVFIRLDEEGYKKQWVTLGANNGSEVQILSGLKPGDEVVTRGAYQIKLSSASNAIPAHSHSH